MTRAAAAIDRFAIPAAAPIAALLACTVAAAALVLIGPIIAVGVVGLVGILLLIRRPGIGLTLLLVTTVVMEADEHGFLPITAKYYIGPPSINEVVMATATVGVLLDLGIRHRLPVLPEPFTVPLALLGLAFVGGTVTGHFSNGNVSDVFFAVRPIGYLILVAFLTVNLLRDRRAVKLFVAGAAALGVYKGIEGSLAWVVGGGRTLEGATLTYYEPTSNFVMLLFILGVVCAVLMRVPLPLWAKLATPFVIASFGLALRRNFWIAGVLAIVLAIMLTSGIRGRRLVFPTVLALMASLWVAIAAGGATRVEGPIVDRASTLAPTSLEERREDVYRLQEIKNVTNEIRNNPVTGLGLGVPWSAVEHPLPEEHNGGRYYTHVVVFWYWLKLGLLGLAAYFWIMAVAILTAVRIWRFSDDTWLKVAGLAAATGLAGLMVAETTGSFTGVNYRFSVLIGALIGWLAAARMHGLRSSPPAQTS